MKGIILAGGTGSRLFPLTKAVSKQLLPVYDKPMIFYPLSVLMLAGIRDILIITNIDDDFLFRKLLGDGSSYGINISYKVQTKPRGIADAFIVGSEFIDGEKVALVLGDNIFWGNGLTTHLSSACSREIGATIFAYSVPDPMRYGVVQFNDQNKAISIEEKPADPKSNFAVTGLYFYDETVVDRVSNLKPSSRGELEITDLNNSYLDEGDIFVQPLGRGFAWLDTGTHDSLLEASSFVSTVESRQGCKIACLEEIAWNKKWIGKKSMLKSIHSCENTGYSSYLKNLLSGELL